MSQVITMSLSESQPPEKEEHKDEIEMVTECSACSCEQSMTPEPEISQEIHEPVEREAHDDKREKAHNEHFEAFLRELEKQQDVDNKLQCTVDFMEASLAQAGTPHFKSFWEARNICLNLFKENINPSLRSQLWTKYSELTKEARRLKEILDEQSAFAVEQIEIAIKALESDIEQFQDHLERVSDLEFSSGSQALDRRFAFYNNLQKELNLLNTQASRINALRKELIKTEMRVRQKNKFFQRLSLAGDKVFPRRKELIKEISTQFTADVDAFISEHFSREDIEESVFTLREEIKSLQSFAKMLTLNTQSFTQTRMKLSECWDKIKLAEKERKKERAQQKVVHKQNADSVFEKIKAFNEAYTAAPMANHEAHKILEEISGYMRKVDLGRDEIKMLREELANARKPLADKQKHEEQERQHQEAEKDRAKRQKLIDIKQEIETLSKDNDSITVEQLVSQRDGLIEKVATSNLTKSEKLELERMLKPLRDVISEKKEKALLALSDDDRQALTNLKEVLRERKERRQEIKSQLETFRKSSGASGLDFEQAMSYKNQLSTEKERLEKINQSISEIEDKIDELESSN
jgi:hypothetical protein